MPKQFRAPDFDDFCRSMRRASRFTLLSMAHDYLLVLERLGDEQRDTILNELDKEQDDDAK